MTPTGAITEAVAAGVARQESIKDRVYVTHEQPGRPTSPDDAAAILIEGAAAGFYTLPPAVQTTADNAAALATAERRVRLALEAYEMGWEGAALGELAAKFRDGAPISALDGIGPEMARRRTEEAALRDQLRVLEDAGPKAATYPATIAATEAEAIGDALTAALNEVIRAASPHAKAIATVDPGAANPDLSAFRRDPKGYAALEALVPRFEAIVAAGAALAALGGHCEGLDGIPDVGLPLLSLAIAAAA